MKQLCAGFIRKFRIVKTCQPVHAVRVRAALPMTEHIIGITSIRATQSVAASYGVAVFFSFFPVHNNLINCQKAFSPGLYSPAQPCSAMTADK